MKKYLIVAFIFVVAFTFIACGGGSKTKSSGAGLDGKTQTYRTEWWVDENTYRLRAGGAPGANQEGKNKMVRRESARRAAILNAQFQVLEKFKGSSVQGAAGMSDFELTGIAISQEVEGVVKGGSVIEATYDSDDNCEVLYEVKARGLKKKVENATWK